VALCERAHRDPRPVAGGWVFAKGVHGIGESG
jgi:hypothetical protein